MTVYKNTIVICCTARSVHCDECIQAESRDLVGGCELDGKSSQMPRRLIKVAASIATSLSGKSEIWFDGKMVKVLGELFANPKDLVRSRIK
jgi:hypothetical protein